MLWGYEAKSESCEHVTFMADLHILCTSRAHFRDICTTVVSATVVQEKKKKKNTFSPKTSMNKKFVG